MNQKCLENAKMARVEMLNARHVSFIRGTRSGRGHGLPTARELAMRNRLRKNLEGKK